PASLDPPHPREGGQFFRRLLAMKLHRIQRAAGQDGRRVPVHEHTDRLHKRRQRGDDRSRLLWRDLPGAGRKDEAQSVRPRLHGHQRILAIRDPADLHSHAESSRTFAATSRSRTSASPTRTASTPQAATRATSAALPIPLSLTSTRSSPPFPFT